MKLNLLIPILISLSACNFNKGDKSPDTNFIQKKEIISVEQFGDSLRIEVEKRGDTILRHFIDIKGISDDSFDNSYTARCIFKSVKANIDTTIKSNYYIDFSGFRLYFNKSIKDECNSKIDSIKKASNNQDEIANLNAIKSNFSDKSFCIGCYEDLISNIKLNIVHLKTGKKARSILSEKYETEFSGGKNLLVITETNDTLSFEHVNLWMR